MNLQRLCIFSAVGLALSLACASEHGLSPAPSGIGPGPLSIDATVRFEATVEGGCWGLATTRGVYEPVGLPAAFRVDHQAVHVVIRDAPGWASNCMIGPLVHVDSIRAR
jgi:hypothetical protein